MQQQLPADGHRRRKVVERKNVVVRSVGRLRFRFRFLLFSFVFLLSETITSVLTSVGLHLRIHRHRLLPRRLRDTLAPSAFVIVH